MSGGEAPGENRVGFDVVLVGVGAELVPVTACEGTLVAIITLTLSEAIEARAHSSTERSGGA